MNVNLKVLFIPWVEKISRLKFKRGGTEAKNSEPLQLIIDWLMESPDIAWRDQLRKASQAKVPEPFTLVI